jgi:hypothetical protein
MIYCSYSQKDRPVVQRVCQSLIEKGVQLFVDYEQLAGGDYAQELTKQIESAEAILFFYSDNTENSTWVKHEIEYSLTKKKRVIPIILSEPESNSWLSFHFAQIRFYKIDNKNLDFCIGEIIDALKKEDSVDDEGRIIKKNNIRGTDHESYSSLPTILPMSEKHKNATVCWWGILPILILIIVGVYLCIRTSSPLSKIENSSLPNSIDGVPLIIEEEDSLSTQCLPSAEGVISDQLDSSDYTIAHIEINGKKVFLIDCDQDGIFDILTFDHNGENAEVDETQMIDISDQNISINNIHESDSIHIIDVESSNYDESIADEEDTTNGRKSLIFYMIGSFFVGVSLALLLQKRLKSKKHNIKLSSDIASKISIDGDLLKEIESREVYTTHLEKGEYLIDFVDKKDENRHKTFNHEVTSKDCKLVFANFLEESSHNGKTIKCFIAGSKTLQQERDALRAVTCVMYNKWDSKNFRILSYTFEDFKKEHTLVPPQELYNKFIEEEADWALFFIDGKVGGITVNEYRIAMDSFKKNGKPKILALAKVGSENNEKVAEIRDEINKEHQYWTDYADIVSLKYIFESTLNWDLIRMFQDKL